MAGGNEGSVPGRLSDPAIDPYVLSVGASAPTAGDWGAATVAPFSSRGTTARHVDLVAPGTSIAGLRAPGSYIDRMHPEGLVSGDTTGRLFRGSGTSQATAVTSGAVALLLQAYPDLTPDQVKATLTATARPLPGSAVDGGAGQLDLAGALKTARKFVAATYKGRDDDTAQNFAPATGLGSLEAARGGSNLVDAETGAVLRGEIDVQNQPWDAATWSAASAAGSAWSGGTWNRARWTGEAWAGSTWTSTGWDGARWGGARWGDLAWGGARWGGARWGGSRWSGSRWTDQDWQ